VARPDVGDRVTDIGDSVAPAGGKSRAVKTRLARRLGTGLAAVALALAVGGCSGSGSKGAANANANDTARSTAGGATTGAVPPEAQPGIPAIVQRVSPSVVTVITPSGLGSGVVWSSDGTIVTDDHVVSGNAQVTVAFADGRRVPGTVLAGDQATDLAVVKAQRNALPAASFASGLPEVGALAIAIGSPLGFENTVSAGIVSGVQRSIPGSASQGPALADLIQTDAAISPGDSGGALVDGQGHVIGINEAYIPPSQGAVSIGFATPAATVQDVVPQLLKSGRAVHAFFGVQAETLTASVGRELGLSVTEGAVVVDVVGGSPAAKAGIQSGDVITALDGTRVGSVEDFVGALRTHRPGDVVTVKVVRGGSTTDVKVTLSGQPG
jgi:S1-C subfamily serine protease